MQSQVLAPQLMTCFCLFVFLFVCSFLLLCLPLFLFGGIFSRILGMGEKGVEALIREILGFLGSSGH